MSRRGVIFDLDGTLANTLETIAGVVNYALNEMGFEPHPVDTYRGMVGDGIVKLCERALPADRQDAVPELLVTARDRYREKRSEGASLYEGVAPLLEALAGRGARLGVLSNKPHELTLGTLDDLGVTGHFHYALGATDRFPPKPDPAGAHHVLERLGTQRERTLYVGDTATDMQTARAAGLIAVGVLWGFRGRDELVAHGDVHVVGHPSELVALFDGN